MVVTLISKDRLHALSLPEKPSGRYWVTDCDETGHFRKVADIEGGQNRWFIQGSAVLGLLDGAEEVPSMELPNEEQVIHAFYREDGSKVQLFVEPSSDCRQTYEKYYVSDNCVLSLGRESGNQIVFNNRYVSAHHARLAWTDGEWSITDLKSRNGTFVNEQRVFSTSLLPGDVVFVMGLKIVLGEGFFAINNPSECVSVQAREICKNPPRETEEKKGGCHDARLKKECFYRSPRLYRDIVKAEIRVDAPPAPEKMAETPLALLIGPALTMGMTAAVMGVVAILNFTSGRADLLTVIPTLFMSAAMLCGTLLWPLLTKRYDTKKRNKAEEMRRKKYLEYLDYVKGRIYELGTEQKRILLENAPDIAECEKRVLECRWNLWERSFDQKDFLSLRIGIGDIPLLADIRFPEKRFLLDDDTLQNELNRFADAPKVLTGAPVVLSMLKNPVTGIAGDPMKVKAFLHNLILQIIALHSYDEVKLMFLVDEAETSEWNYCRFLPHSWDGDVRYFSTNSEEAKTLSMSLEQIIQKRNERVAFSKEEPVPHYVVITSDVEMAAKADIFNKIHSGSAGAGISCIAIASRLTDLPKECSAVIDLTGEEASLYDRNDASGQKTVFQAEGTVATNMDRVAEVLANVVTSTDSANLSLPNMLTFLEMYGVGKTEHLNALDRWKENNPVNSLKVPIGVSKDGALFYLDLHEKAHGPHGLIAGMTGSGKSELIITFILSMAANYRPDEVSFILIDYKGGGLAGAFENSLSGVKLPHLAGTITNLDGSAVSRALISIQSEMRRRQEIFNAARQISGEGTIDIYKYQKMYRSGLVDQPVPHLFIISDEFAELKSQQPEFMTQLISAARIGRSLGIHLILATQKPSGVVDDQIWSNSRFRICLKVQEKNDSAEMLKRPDAAELKETGRFYLQVGFNELFEMGQSAWCGAPYIPKDRLEKKRDDSIEVIDHWGHVLYEAKQKNTDSGREQGSQIVSVVQYLSALAKEEHVEATPLWLPQLPAMIYLEELEKKYHRSISDAELNPIVGEFDDPATQSQGLLTIPFSKEGNALVYGVAGSGKTIFLDTVLMDLIRNYSAKQLNLYLVDMGEEGLAAFSEAPQVGDVLLSSDKEKLYNLFKLLREEVSSRKKAVVANGGKFSCDGEYPQILVVIHNYAAFAEQFEELDEQLIQLTRDCSKYGIYFMMTTTAVTAVRYRVAQNFTNVYALQLSDRADYVGLFGGTNGVYPSKHKGRGLCRRNDKVYEFQTAYFARETDRKALAEYLKGIVQDSPSVAKAVPILPEHVSVELFDGTCTPDAVPVGISKEKLQPCTMDFEQAVVSLILSRSSYDLAAFVRPFCTMLSKLPGTVTVLDGAAILFDHCTVNFEDAVNTLFDEAVLRHNTCKKCSAEGKALPQYERQYYVITGLQRILNGLSVEGRDKLNTLLEKAERAFNLRFILCESVGEASPLTVNAWYKRHVNESEGLWIGNGIMEQYVLKVGKSDDNLHLQLPAEFGFVVKRGRATLVKLINENALEVTEE